MAEIPANHWLNNVSTKPKPEPEVCPACEGGGWECYGIGRNDPHFRVCETCGNPEDHKSP